MRRNGRPTPPARAVLPGRFQLPAHGARTGAPKTPSICRLRVSTTFVVHLSTYVVHLSTYVVHLSTFVVHLSPFVVHLSTLVVHLSTLVVHLSFRSLRCRKFSMAFRAPRVVFAVLRGAIPAWPLRRAGRCWHRPARATRAGAGRGLRPWSPGAEAQPRRAGAGRGPRPR